jgi:pimeloyl-ACP methyl ester carboxylesterase
VRWHLFAIDLRGHGKSSWAAGSYRPEHYAEDIRILVEAKAIDRVVLLGHSLGGWIALEAAARLGNKVRAIILADPPLNTERFVVDESREVRTAMWRALRDLVASELSYNDLISSLADLQISLPLEKETVRYGDLPGVSSVQIRGWAKDLHRLDPDVAAYHAEGRMREYVDYIDVDQSLRDIECPVLIIQGDPSSGGINSDEDAEHALELLSCGAHIKLEQVGHDLGLDSWEVGQFLMAVTNFLESL